MSSETDKLIEEVTSTPFVKDVQSALTGASEQLSALHPQAKCAIEGLTSIISTALTFLADYKSYAEPYAPTAAKCLQNAKSVLPAYEKMNVESLQALAADYMAMVPEDARQKIKAGVLALITSLLSGFDKIRSTEDPGQLKNLVNETLMSFEQVKGVVDHASALANNVSENETAIKAANASTEAFLSKLDPEARAQYEALPDATSKAQFAAEQSWKVASSQMKAINERLSASLPEPLKSGFTAILSTTENVAANMPQLPSNSDVMSKIHVAVDTFSKYLTTLKKWLESDDTAKL